MRDKNKNYSPRRENKNDQTKTAIDSNGVVRAFGEDFSINIDGCRVPHVTLEGGNLSQNSHLRNTINGGNGGKIFPKEESRRVVVPNDKGRHPANLMHDGSAEVVGMFPDEKSRFFHAF